MTKTYLVKPRRHTAVQKPHVPLSAMIVINIPILLKTAGLLFLSILASRQPTLTEQLSSFAMLRMGAALAHRIPALSALDARDVEDLDKYLDKMAGWICDAGEYRRENAREL